MVTPEKLTLILKNKLQTEKEGAERELYPHNKRNQPRGKNKVRIICKLTVIFMNFESSIL